MRKYHFLYALPIGSLLLAACGSSDSASQTGDSGPDVVQPVDDGGVDSGAGEDAGMMMEPGDAEPGDATTTPPGDSGPDAAPPVDASVDGGPDAGSPADGGAPADAAPDAIEALDATPDTSTSPPDAGVDAGLDAAPVVEAGPVTPTYAIGGTVAGLGAGDSVVLQDNLGDNLIVSANTSFTFPTPLATGATYSATVLTSPTAPISQVCTVTGDPTGTVMGAAISDIAINCTTNTFTVGATVTGVATNETVTLADDVGDTVTVGNGSFAFATAYNSGAGYTVTATAQPLNPILQTCTVASSPGTVGNANVNVAVTCVTNPYSLGGTVHGLVSGKGFTLTESVSGQALAVSANGVFTFGNLIPNGNLYAVTVTTQPTNSAGDTTPQLCNVVAGAGTEPQMNQTNVQVYCGTNCAAIHAVLPLLGSGDFTIDPDGTDSGAGFPAYCDMNFQGGGWTLVQSTNGGSCGPNSETSGEVLPGTCRFSPVAPVQSLANLGTLVHVRSAANGLEPTTYATSATGLPIGNLRLGTLLNANEDATVAEAQWSVVGLSASVLDFNNGCINGSVAWPDVYWACGNSGGWHLTDTHSLWVFSSNANIPMEVYVK